MFRLFAVMLLATVMLPVASGIAPENNVPPDRIEEDWELVIAIPAPNLSCPQVSTMMKASPAEAVPSMVLNMNYRDSPSFRAGGLQVKAMLGNQPLVFATQHSEYFRTQNETITWTQRLGLSGGNLNFRIISGNSTTWGIFGGDDLSVTTASTISSLADYNPDMSVADSGPSFGSNRLTSMKLLRVRYYQGENLLSTDSTARSVKLTN